ncbi:neutral zinc metallopeptidase [Nonomuraea ferruginea]
MMAHEYGHHVQNLTGLLDSWWGQTLETSNQNGKLALSRRLELQATCFGGMWMRSVAASYPVSTSSSAAVVLVLRPGGRPSGIPA